ncbi:MAG: ankyrin repeat domain-containing protein [Planctomycetota bacterium]
MKQGRLSHLIVLFFLVTAWSDCPLTATAGPLHDAARKGDLKAVQTLIEKGADVDARGQEGRTPLHCAVGNKVLKDSHLDVVKLLLAHGAVIDAKDELGGTPLNIAADTLKMPSRKEDATYRIVEFLVAEGADIHAKPEHGWTALHWVVDMGHKDLAELLLVKGAKVDSTDGNGNTPLHWAVSNYASSRRVFSMFGPELAGQGMNLLPGRPEGNLTDLTRLLIAKGADVNAKNSDGDTPLVWAAKSADIELVRLLVASGAEVRVTGKGIDTPWYSWTGKGRPVIPMGLLARRAGGRASAAAGTTPLHLAAKQGDKNVAEFLIAQGADVNAKNQVDATPLGFAVGGHRDIKELPNAYNAESYSERADYFYKQMEYDRAIEDYTSAIRVDQGNAQMYIRRGRTWAKKGDSKRAASDWKKAIELNWANALDIYYYRHLLESRDAGLDRLMREVAARHLQDLKTVSGYAVGFAGAPGEFYTISLILSKPFEEDQFLKMVRNDNPVVRAMALICLARHDRTRYEETIRSFYTDRTEVRYMPYGCSVTRTTLDQLARNILERPDVLDTWSASHTEGRGRTARLDSRRKAEARERKQVVEALISNGAAVNVEDKRREIPLHYAAQRGYKHVAELLIANGAEVNASSNSGETPLHCATLWGYRDVVELLIANGADVNLKTETGSTALQTAMDMGYQGLSSLLREHGAEK